MLSPDLPDMRGCPVMPMGAIPRLFMAVAQAFGSDMGIPNELESIAILRRPSIQEKKERENLGFKTLAFHFHYINKINVFQTWRLNIKSSQYRILLWKNYNQNDFGFTYENQRADIHKNKTNNNDQESKAGKLETRKGSSLVISTRNLQSHSRAALIYVPLHLSKEGNWLYYKTFNLLMKGEKST